MSTPYRPATENSNVQLALLADEKIEFSAQYVEPSE